MHPHSHSDLRRRWRRQVAARHFRTSSYWPRPAGALGFLVDGGRGGALVELGKLLTVVVHDEPTHRARPAIRVCGYRAGVVEHGVLWGGPENSRIFKNLALQPRPRARGERFDLCDAELLLLAMRLDHRVCQAARYEESARHRPLRLPRLWAGFRQASAGRVRGDGPELEQLAKKFGLSTEAMFQKFRRPHEGLVLWPLDWVSDQLADAVAVFAELAGLPARQAFGLGEVPGGLVGYDGAAAFDFFHSRFRPVGNGHRPLVATA